MTAGLPAPSSAPRGADAGAARLAVSALAPSDPISVKLLPPHSIWHRNRSFGVRSPIDLRFSPCPCSYSKQLVPGTAPPSRLSPSFRETTGSSETPGTSPPTAAAWATEDAGSSKEGGPKSRALSLPPRRPSRYGSARRIPSPKGLFLQTKQTAASAPRQTFHPPSLGPARLPTAAHLPKFSGPPWPRGAASPRLPFVRVGRRRGPSRSSSRSRSRRALHPGQGCHAPALGTAISRHCSSSWATPPARRCSAPPSPALGPAVEKPGDGGAPPRVLTRGNGNIILARQVAQSWAPVSAAPGAIVSKQLHGRGGGGPGAGRGRRLRGAGGRRGEAAEEASGADGPDAVSDWHTDTHFLFAAHNLPNDA